MHSDLESEIKELVSNLENQNKPYLAREIDQNWNKTSLSYSLELNSWKPSRPMEKELSVAFDLELTRLGFADLEKIKVLESLEKKRLLQTGPHLGATENPRMLCVNWLGSLGVKNEDFYVVGMFSAIPLSNSFHPGRINRNSESVNLFNSTMQDGMVYRSLIQTKLLNAVASLPKAIQELTPKATEGESYTKWALQTCQRIEGKVLNKDNLIFIDINEVITNYLIQVLNNKNHILYKLFFDKKTREEFAQIFNKETIFYKAYMNGKYEVMENLYLKDDVLESKHYKIKITNPENLIEELKNERLCPALLLGFMVTAFINEFKCLGSFRQVEYLPAYQERLLNLNFFKDLKIENIPTSNLTTGNFPAYKNLYPVDALLGAEFKPENTILFGELILSMKKMLEK